MQTPPRAARPRLWEEDEETRAKKACLAPTRRSLFAALSDASVPESPSRVAFGDRLDQSSQSHLHPTRLDWCAACRASRAPNSPYKCECAGGSLIARPASSSLTHVTAHPALRWQVI